MRIALFPEAQISLLSMLQAFVPSQKNARPHNFGHAKKCTNYQKPPKIIENLRMVHPNTVFFLLLALNHICVLIYIDFYNVACPKYQRLAPPTKTKKTMRLRVGLLPPLKQRIPLFLGIRGGA